MSLLGGVLVALAGASPVILAGAVWAASASRAVLQAQRVVLGLVAVAAIVWLVGLLRGGGRLSSSPRRRRRVLCAGAVVGASIVLLLVVTSALRSRAEDEGGTAGEPQSSGEPAAAADICPLLSRNPWDEPDWLPEETGVRPGRIHVSLPERGVARCLGLPGAVPPVHREARPWRVEVAAIRDGRRVAEVVLDADVVGGFVGALGKAGRRAVRGSDSVLVTPRDGEGRTAARFTLPFWATSDPTSFVVRPRRLATIEMTTGPILEVPERALESPTRLGLDVAEPRFDVTPPLPFQLGTTYRFSLERVEEMVEGFNPARPSKRGDGADYWAVETIRVLVPAPPGSLPGGQVLVVEQFGYAAGVVLSVASVGALVEREGRVYLGNLPEHQPDLGGATCADVLAGRSSRCLVAQRLKEFRRSFQPTFIYQGGPPWPLVTAAGWRAAVPMAVVSNTGENIGWATGGCEPLPGGRRAPGCEGFMLAVPPGELVTLRAVDASTGWIVASHDPAWPGREGGVLSLTGLQQVLPL